MLDESEYAKVLDEAGKARFAVSPVGRSGARAVIGIGEGSELRQALSYLKSLSGHELKLDWLGDWAMLGVEDQSMLATLSQDVMSGTERDLLQAPPDGGATETRDEKVIGEIAALRVYAAVAVRSPIGATLALAALRAIANEAAPGLFEWSEASTHRGVPIVRVRLNPAKAREEFGRDVQDVQLFYAIAGGAIVFALREPVLRHVIDDRLDGKGPGAPAGNAAGTQLAFDLAADKGGGLWTALTWLFELGLLEERSPRSAAAAEALLRGAPERTGDAAAMRSLSLAYLGAVPVAPDGGLYRLRPEGIEDPARGTSFAPVWPAVPVAGSPLEAVMTAFVQGRTEVSFDDEGPSGAPGPRAPPLRSLHVRASLDVR
jgi:hypothetical protein